MPIDINQFNRRNKYRVWFAKDKRWIHGPHEMNSLDGVNLLGETILFGEMLRMPDDTHVSIADLNEVITLEYANLQDRNGKDIFEGDIIEALTDENEGDFYAKEPKWIKKLFYVWFDTTQACFRSRYLDWVYTCSGAEKDGKPVEGLISQYSASREWTVIGNVFDNPELCK